MQPDLVSQSKNHANPKDTVLKKRFAVLQQQLTKFRGALLVEEQLPFH